MEGSMETLRKRTKRLGDFALILLAAADGLQRAGFEVDEELIQLLQAQVERGWIAQFASHRDGEPQDLSSDDGVGYPDRPELTE